MYSCVLSRTHAHARTIQLVLRNVSVDGEGDGGSFGNVGATMRAWDAVDNAFVNYFGLQRFGSSSVPTFDLGKSMLKHAWDQVRRGCRTLTVLSCPRPDAFITRTH